MNYKRAAFGIIAVGLSLVALYMTTTFYATYGRDDAEAKVFIALAVFSLAIKLAAPSAAATLRGHYAWQLMLWAGVVGAIFFDALGTAGYVEMTYGSKSGAAVIEAKDYKDAESKRDAARNALNEYSDAKGSAAEAELAVTAAKAEAGNCKRREHTDACKAIVAAETALARVAERDRRAAVLKSLEQNLTKLEKPTTASDPQAAILRKLGSRIGWDSLGDFVAVMLSVLMFLFFEIVAPAMAFAALHGSISKPVVNPPESRARPPDKPPAAAGRRPRAPRSSSDTVLILLNDLVAGSRSAPDISVSGRKVYGAQRAIGQALGVSGAAVNRQLTALRDAGTIAIDTSGGRTEIELLG